MERAGPTGRPGKTVVTTDRLRQPIATFSHAVRYGALVVVGAKGSTGPGVVGAAHPGDPGAQIERVLANTGAAMRELGADLDDAVLVRMWVSDWRQLAAIQAVAEPLLARSGAVRPVFRSAAFPIPGFLVETDVIAADRTVPRDVLAGRSGPLGLRAGDLAFADGVVERARPSEDARDTFTRALETLCEDLAHAGIPQDRLLRVSVGLGDVRDAPGFVDAWRRVLAAPRPPCAVAVSTLRDARARIELGAVAALVPVHRAPFPAAGSGESMAARAGELVFTAASDSAGVLGVAEAAPGSAVDQLVRHLGAVGAAPDDVIRVGAALVDWRGYDRFNGEYRRHFTAPYPARTTTETTLAGREAVQVEAIAGLERARHTVLASA